MRPEVEQAGENLLILCVVAASLVALRLVWLGLAAAIRRFDRWHLRRSRGRSSSLRCVRGGWRS